MSAGAIVQLFYNPTSGSHSPRKLNALARSLEAAGATVIRAQSLDCTPAIALEATHVCIAGGDGTVRHVATALARCGRSLPAAILPAGTVNLLAREAGFSGHPEQLARRLLAKGSQRRHFGASLGDTMFFACASAGPESLAIARHSPRLKRVIGRLAYATAFCRLLVSWPRMRMRLTSEGRTYACEAVYVAKGRFFAGPWSFAPLASSNEALLHIVALERCRRRNFLGFCLDMLLGRDPAKRQGVTAFTCTALKLECDGAMPIQADGDVVAQLPVAITLDARPVLFL
jgi:diacylglycerol kinase family enzyme